MLVLILNPKVFLGKFGPKNWNSPNWLKFDKGVHCFILISNLKFIFKNFCHTFFWANLVQKSDFPQINCYMFITTLMFSFTKNFVSHIFSDKFNLKIWSSPNWLKFGAGLYYYMFIYDFNVCHSYNFGKTWSRNLMLSPICDH